MIDKLIFRNFNSVLQSTLSDKLLFNKVCKNLKIFKDVGVAIKEVVKQSKDVVDAAAGKKRKGRKPKAKK